MNLPEKVNGIEQGKPPIVSRDRGRAKNALKAISLGHTTKMAAQAAGVSRRTLYEWRYKGEAIRQLKEDSPEELPLTPYDQDYLWFLKAWEKAEYKRKEALLKAIDDAGKTSWQAKAWLAERLYPDEFSKTRKIEVGTAVEGNKEAWSIMIGDETAQIGSGNPVEEADYEILTD